MRQFILALCATLAMVGCGSEEAPTDALRDRVVTMPDGRKVTAEALVTPSEIQRGMMFRTSIAPDRGMLFFHSSAGKYKYWMFQCKISLDIIWMDAGKRIVEISADTPPCAGAANECPTYGGNYDAQYVLELGGGGAARYGVKVGDVLRF